jgi:hypothetical protein
MSFLDLVRASVPPSQAKILMLHLHFMKQVPKETTAISLLAWLNLNMPAPVTSCPCGLSAVPHTRLPLLERTGRVQENIS